MPAGAELRGRREGARSVARAWGADVHNVRLETLEHLGLRTVAEMSGIGNRRE